MAGRKLLSMPTMLIDTSFDFRTDAGGPDRDPDRYSPTLKQYHQLLWSKTLPDGRPFDLQMRRGYLHHQSDLGEFWLSGDSIIHTYVKWRSMKDVIDQFPVDESEQFRTLAYTIGNMIVFPANKVGVYRTINGERGCNPKIKDRFDLTLECIRRFYMGETDHPLHKTLTLYRDFFALFTDFKGYVEFFLLQDLVTDEGAAVRFLMPFADFNASLLPGDRDTYAAYRRRSIEFIEARNRRIERYAAAYLEGDHSRSDGGTR
jgi:hypothetical protein